MNNRVRVRLDRRRPYRAQPQDRAAIWVGPGEVEVPAWVAEAWGMQAAVAVSTEKDSAPPVPVTDPTAPVALPLADYDSLSAAQIIQAIPGLTAEERAALTAYEQGNKARKTVLDALEGNQV